MKTPRPYQAAAQTSLFKYLFEEKGHPLVVAPVAAGKSLMIAEFIKQLHEYYPGMKILKLTHVKELLQQNAEELLGQYPGADFGFYCAGLKQKKLRNQITFASIQSIYKKAYDLYEMGQIPGIIIIDEVHLLSHRQNTTYRKFISDILKYNPKCRVVGYTGTPFRADTGRLERGENKLFDDIAYEIGMDFMIEEGYWTKPVCPEMANVMDVTGVGVRGGDYIENQLQERINVASVTEPCVRELLEKGANRNKWLIFTAGIDHAEDVTTAINEAGVEAHCIHSKKDLAENAGILKAHRRGDFKALVNVAKLTTGYNDPYIDLLAFMRPTRSPVLYIQTTGRGVRPVYQSGYDLSTKQGRLSAIANGPKPDCMVLDFGGVVSTLGPIDGVSITKDWDGEEDPKKKEGEEEAGLIKICPACGAECASNQRYCYACSYCFIRLDEKAGDKAIVSVDSEPEWYSVIDTWHSEHKKEGGKTSMRVTYVTIADAIKEWICFEHEGYARERAKDWHIYRMPDEPVPETVEKALTINYPKPIKILAKKQGKFWRVLDYQFPEKPPEMVEDPDFEIPF